MRKQLNLMLDYVAGTNEGICMVEGSAQEISEKEFLDVMFKAHDKIKDQITWQENIVKEVGQQKEAMSFDFEWNTWTDKIDEYLTPERVKSVYLADKIEETLPLKHCRNHLLKKMSPQ